VELTDALVAMIDALNAEQIDYMLVGSFSSNYYGIPRSTNDADLVIQLPAEGMQKLRSRLAGKLRFDPQTTFESVTATICTRVYVPETHYKLELFRLSSDAHDQERFRRRVHVSTLGRQVSLPTAEDVIITKVRWAESQNRRKDIDDVREVLAVQMKNLDWSYLYRWTDEHGSRGLLDRIVQSVSNIE
jgi:hypothetical protein